MAIGACGISCDVCGLYEKKICGGCASGTDCTEERVNRVPCPVLKCAFEKGVSYCMKDCEEFPCKCHEKGYPFSGAYLGMHKARMGKAQ